jgi:hypothetical protein
MSDLIYDKFSSDNLDNKINEARKAYGSRSKRAMAVINSIDRLKTKVCATYTQYYFSLGHCTTAIGEGFNSTLKGTGALKEYMADATLSTGIERCLKLTRTQDNRCIEMMEPLREEEKRWSNFYQDHYNEFARRAGTDVTSCDKVGDSDQLWKVKDRFGNEVTVNKSAVVVHLGHEYIIPICECGDWCTWFIWCPHIIRVYTVSGKT